VVLALSPIWVRRDQLVAADLGVDEFALRKGRR
jgi:hypothetical protein